MLRELGRTFGQSGADAGASARRLGWSSAPRLCLCRATDAEGPPTRHRISFQQQKLKRRE